MNLPKLKDILNSILKEDASADKAAQDAKKVAIDKEIAALEKKKTELSKGPQSPLGEADLDEAKKFKLVDPDLDTTRFADKRISRVSLQDILDYIKEMNDTGVEVAELQRQFGFVRPQIANNIMNGLFQSNIVGKVSGDELQTYERPAAPPAGEETTPGEEDDDNDGAEPDVMATEPGYEDTGIVDKDLSDEEIDASFAKAKFAGEEEPEMQGTEKPVDVSGAKEKAVNFFIDDSNARLFQKLIGNFKASKIRVREASGEGSGDLSSSDFAAAEKARKEKAAGSIDDLIKQYADRIIAASEGDPDMQREIMTLLAKKLESVGYNILFKKISKLVGTNVETPALDNKDKEVMKALDVEDEEEIDEEQLFKEMLRRRAGL